MDDLNNTERKKKRIKTFEEWEASHNFKTVDPKIVAQAIAREYDVRENNSEYVKDNGEQETKDL
jgi:hypothetical protein